MREQRNENDLFDTYRKVRHCRPTVRQRVLAHSAMNYRIKQSETFEVQEKKVPFLDSGPPDVEKRNVEYVSKPQDERALMDAFDAIIEKILSSLDPVVVKNDQGSEKKRSFLSRSDTFEEVFTAKYASVKHFFEQGLFYKELKYRLERNTRKMNEKQ